MIANTPVPPYYAVIFTTVRREGDLGYAEMATKILDLAKRQPGFLGVEAARNEVGVSVSYWSDLDSIRQWKSQLDHQLAQQLGRERWYSAYKTRIAKVERDYSFDNND